MTRQRHVRHQSSERRIRTLREHAEIALTQDPELARRLSQLAASEESRLLHLAAKH